MNISLQTQPLIALRPFYELSPKERNEALVTASKGTKYEMSLDPDGSGRVALDDEVFEFMKQSGVEVMEDEHYGILFSQGNSLWYAVPLFDGSSLDFSQMRIL